MWVAYNFKQMAAVQKQQNPEEYSKDLSYKKTDSWLNYPKSDINVFDQNIKTEAN